VLWVATALLYPHLRDAISTFVDVAILRRPDFTALGAALARELAATESPGVMLDLACARLAPALSARSVVWGSPHAGAGADGEAEAFHAAFREISAEQAELLLSDWTGREEWVTLRDARSAASAGLPEGLASARAVVTVPTVEQPTYLFAVAGLEAGRRLLSDDVALLNTVAAALARRIDAVRVAHVRCQHELREQETSKLATEAELKALRAQINPHFLFNALTTIGYLIQASPDRALDTLMRLTELLRAVLRTAGEFSSLGEEIDLVESYLDIERERFEERLQAHIDVPEPLRGLRIPSLVVQPLVENAIKHAISPSASGGSVSVEAHLEGGEEARQLVVAVTDTGAPGPAEPGERRGVGLSSIRRRLECHYGSEASLEVELREGAGTTATLRLPARDAARRSAGRAGALAGGRRP
jgi:hypothetical protein